MMSLLTSMGWDLTRCYMRMLWFSQELQMGLVRITSLYPNFNGSHFGLPPSSIPRMIGLGGKFVWTMTYSHGPRYQLYGLGFCITSLLLLYHLSSGRRQKIFLPRVSTDSVSLPSHGTVDTVLYLINVAVCLTLWRSTVVQEAWHLHVVLSNYWPYKNDKLINRMLFSSRIWSCKIQCRSS